MRFDILTIFPHLFASPLEEGIIRRALRDNRITVHVHNIRDFATGKHAMTDDRPYGGGEGMVMKPEPIAAALEHVRASASGGRVVLLSPQGRPYSQEVAGRFAAADHLVLLCGRYEGVDERVSELFVDEEISIGDYILTGGELAAMIIIDSVTRLLPGVLGCADSAAQDTFSNGLLKNPQYTRPRVFAGREVPPVLLNGDHEAIAAYRFVASVRATLKKRPDLLAGVKFTDRELEILHRNGLTEAVARAGNNGGIKANNLSSG